MNRKILLFVCTCLAASLLAVRLHHRRATDLATPLTNTAIKPVDDFSVSIPDPVESSAKSVSLQAEHDSNTLTVPETILTNISVTEEKNAAPDKYQALRELREWASRDPEAALAAVLTLPDGDERNEALAAVCSGLAETDPAAAVKLAREFHLDEQPTAVMQDLVQQWAATDLISSLAWTEDQPAGAPRDEFTTRIAYIMSESDPSDAAALVLKQIPPGPAQDEAIMTVLHQWANQNFVAAANWAKGSVPGPLQDRVINELNGIIEYQRALGQPQG